MTQSPPLTALQSPHHYSLSRLSTLSPFGRYGASTFTPSSVSSLSAWGRGERWGVRFVKDDQGVMMMVVEKNKRRKKDEKEITKSKR